MSSAKPPEILKLPSIKAAPRLLGWHIVRTTPQGRLKLKIVETEAYHQSDPASHSYRGLTARTAPMFQAGGHIYVYFTYGMHYCLNLVTGPKGVGEGVLLRAAEPMEGIEIMKKNRGMDDIRNLANGPGKLTQALGIFDTSLSGKILNKSSIFLEPPEHKLKKEDVVTGPRIGVTKAADQPYRFYLKNNHFVSRRPGGI
ncbi:MAG TPA: DNA-3-methyladenine glycosylase [Candidatus Saccharimonadales bacterium]|nr:DNA-3-methyladenine glycosylase [Candidatus Saccharimonadales bacterium]